MKNKYFPSVSVKVIMISLIFFVIFSFALFLSTQLNSLFTVKVKPLTVKPVIVNHVSGVLDEKIVENVPRRTVAPETVRGIYLTAYSANRTDWIDRLITRMVDGGQINSVIIDIKDYTGYVLYDSKVKSVVEYDTFNPQIDDVEGVIKRFHDAGIYVIARLTAFQDPALARARPDLALKKHGGTTWYNWNGLAFTDPQEEEVWKYNVDIAKEAAALGFDEINFDYMRYPSDGNLSTIDYNIPEDRLRADIMEDFFSYISDELTPIVNTSVDLFGMVMDNVDNEYDLGIGQRLSRTLDHFDYVCPMMYPSHYPDNYLGLGNPAASPGPVVAYGIKKATPYFEGKRASLRPWLQAFSIGAVYNKTLIDAQTIVTETATSTSGWLLWNARNYYEDHIFLP